MSPEYRVILERMRSSAGVVQRAVAAHRGMVLVDSAPSHGTTFTVYFPAARRKEEAA